MNIESLMASLPAGLPKGKFPRQDILFMVDALEASRIASGSFLEVGSLLGRSSVIIGREAKGVGEKLYCVDIWDKEEWRVTRKKPKCPDDILGTFLANIKNHGLETTVIPIKKESENVLESWIKPLRFIHIDGCHSYKSVLIDTRWKKHLIPNGIICFHDYHSKSWPGVVKAVNSEIMSDKNFEKIGIGHSLIAFRRQG